MGGSRQSKTSTGNCWNRPSWSGSPRRSLHSSHKKVPGSNTDWYPDGLCKKWQSLIMMVAVRAGGVSDKDHAMHAMQLVTGHKDGGPK